MKYILLVVLFLTFSVSGTIEDLIALKETSVESICESVRNYYTDEEPVTTCPMFSSCDQNLEATITNEGGTLNCETGFGGDETCGCVNSSLSFDTPTMRLAPGTNPDDEEVLKFICFTNFLKGVMAANKRGDPKIKWQYIGSPTGAFNMWPGKSDLMRQEGKVDPCKRAVTDCPTYDCRLRPWYIAAASGSKDVVLVLDTSGSMEKEGRLALMKEAAKSVIDGLGYFDRLVVIPFASDSEIACGFTGFERTSDANKVTFYNCIDALGHTGSTNCKDGLQRAFNTFKGDVGSESCHKVIQFLTDGVCNDDISSSWIKSNANSVGARIFTYALGSGANTKTTKSVACAGSGLYNTVSDGGDLSEAMSFYYSYFLYSEVARDVVWSEKYEDFSGLGWMTTAALGCYTEQGNILGVAGVDVVLGEFTDIGADFDDDVAPLLYEGSRQCHDLPISANMLEMMRPDDRKCGVCASAQVMFVVFVVVTLLFL